MDTRNSTDAELQQLVSALQESQSDTNRYLDLHTDDAIIVNIAGRRVSGARDLRAAMEAALASPLADVTTTVEVLDIRYPHPDVAIVSCVKHVQDARAIGGDLPDRGALTFLAVRGEDGWRIALAQTTPIVAT